MGHAANIKERHSISCISDKSSLQGRHKEYTEGKSSDKVRSLFSELLLAENFGDKQSKIRFTWIPRTEKGPIIKIETNEKPHNLIKVRSKTRHSVIVVSSASNWYSTESWTFIFNFAVETMIATRVQSNIGGVKGEVITYDCKFDPLKNDPDDPTEALS